jgi:AcrR family transcriptional regulator
VIETEAMDVPPRTRRYESPLRARRAVATRSALVDAATALFASRGWTGTGMRDVAREAGVAVETLYSHFSSKRRLLDAVIDTALVGDDEPIAVAERPEFAALGVGPRADRVAAAASLVTVLHVRTVAFAKLLREAAWADPEIADVLRSTRERQRLDVAGGLALVLDRPPTDIERDGVWALVSPEVHLLLVEESGWSTDQYERWIADSLERVLASS